MDTVTNQLDVQEVLERFYRIRGIGEYDLEEKHRTMMRYVAIPDFPYEEREPALYELEMQFLKDKGLIPSTLS